MADNAVKYQWQVELGERRVETLKSVSGINLDQEGFFGTLTLTRGVDKSEKFTQWIVDSKDPTKSENSAQTIVLAYVNAQNEAVKRFQVEGARASSWTSPDMTADVSSAVDETLELTYTSCTPL